MTALQLSLGDQPVKPPGETVTVRRWQLQRCADRPKPELQPEPDIVIHFVRAQQLLRRQQPGREGVAASPRVLSRLRRLGLSHRLHFPKLVVLRQHRGGKFGPPSW
jgi:hypothetical protein